MIERQYARYTNAHLNRAAAIQFAKRSAWGSECSAINLAEIPPRNFMPKTMLAEKLAVEYLVTEMVWTSMLVFTHLI